MKSISSLIFTSFLLAGCGPTVQEHPTESVVTKNTEEKIKNNEGERYEWLKEQFSKYSDENAVVMLTKITEREPDSVDAHAAKRLLKEMADKKLKAKTDLQAAELASYEACKNLGDSVPSSMVQTNVSNIIAMYRSNNFQPKDQFETSADYAKRRAKESKELGFDIQCIVVDGIGPTYDADKQGWLLSTISTIFTDTVSMYDGDYVVTDKRYIEQSSYIGENAFGVKKEILKSDIASVGVMFPKGEIQDFIGRLGKANEKYSYEIFIPMPIKEAKTVPARALKTLIQYRWNPSGILNFNKNKQPTIDSTIEENHNFDLIKGNVVNIIIFNEETGRVFAQSKGKKKKI